jgi:glycosyltransferase involved in cell wall biosynthesis
MAAIVRLIPRAVLALGGLWQRLTGRRHRGSITWVVGVQDIASIAHQLAEVIPRSYSVSLFPHPFYAHRFDYEWTGPRTGGRFENLVRRPLLLARLAARATGFIYVGHQGFLGTDRAPEFAYLRRHGVRICCVFAGSDIRAPRVLARREEELGFDGFASRLRIADEATYFSDAYDAERRRTAADADRFADVIFSMSTDQAGYLTRETEPFPYLLEPEAFADREAAGTDGPPVVLHAPSNPVMKGTDAVRAAVQKLQAEGVAFRYVELSGVPHEEVRAALRGADIVLNQFHSLVPGVFGMEALAAGCAVLMSADPVRETDLAPGAADAWMRTEASQIEDHLRRVVEDPGLRARLGAAGREWARATGSAEAGGTRLRAILDLVAAGAYRGRVGWDPVPAPVAGSSR